MLYMCTGIEIRSWAEYCVACTAKKSVHGGMVLSIVQQHTNTKVHKYTLIHSDAYIIACTRTVQVPYRVHEYRGHKQSSP